MTQTEESITPGPTPALGAGLKVHGVGVSFSGVIALRDVSLEVQRGEVLGLIGPNGAGKTTLFDVVSGLRPPESGSIFFDGNDITGHSAVARSRAGIRRTFQRQQVFGRLFDEFAGLDQELFDELIHATPRKAGRRARPAHRAPRV